MTTADELDQYAQDYYLNREGHADLALEERVQAWILPWLAGQCRGAVLEMGWGTGVVACGLINAGIGWLTVVEGSERLVAQAHEDAPDAAVVQAMFEEYDPGPVFDTVLALHVLEHVEHPVRMLERISGWLRPGGRLIVVTPNAQSLHRRVGQQMTGDPLDTLSERDRLVGHRRVYTLRGLCADLGAVGFDTAGGVFGWFLKPVNNARMVDWPSELIEALCQLGWEGSAVDAANIGVIARRTDR